MLYGFCRTLDQVLGSLKQNVIEPYNMDVYISTPNTFFGNLDNDPHNSRGNPSQLTNEWLQYNLYGNLKSVNIEPHNIGHYKNEVHRMQLPEQNFMGAKTFRSLNMMDNVRKVINLRQVYERNNNIKYDAVILARPDLIYAKKVELNELDLNKVWHSVSHAAPIYSTSLLMGDHFIFGKPENIDLFMKLYDEIANLYRSGVIINNETLLGMTLLNNNIVFERTDRFLHGIIR
jgi:hypothetical protein